MSINAINQGTIIRVRTRENLLALLKTGRSGWWKVGEYQEPICAWELVWGVWRVWARLD